MFELAKVACAKGLWVDWYNAIVLPLSHCISSHLLYCSILLLASKLGKDLKKSSTGHYVIQSKKLL